MGVRKLVKSNHEVLKEKAVAVKSITDPILFLLEDMVETMNHHQGLGLAAPQLGISKQIIVINKGNGEVLKLINPAIVNSRGNNADVEGCLSLPGIYGEVRRADKIVVEALNENNIPVRMNAAGLLARILQHEVDHLNGVLFIEKAIRLVDPEEMDSKGESS